MNANTVLTVRLVLVQNSQLSIHVPCSRTYIDQCS